MMGPRRSESTDASPDALPFSPAEHRRIELTASSRDTDGISKVVNAGAIRSTPDGPVQVMHNGVVVEAGSYHGAWMVEVIRRLRGHHEPQEEAAFHAVIQRLAMDSLQPTMVELGSFWAYYALWTRRAIPGAACVLVEPDPQNLEVGRRNFRLNHESGSFVRAAIGSADGGVSRFRCESDGVLRETPLISVDGLMRREGIDRIDLLLCDVQGAEFDMLAGASGAIAERRLRFLVVSTHHHCISGDPLTHQRCLHTLMDAGASIIVEHSVPESYSGDGLIVASLDPRDSGFRVGISRARARDSLFGELEPELAAAFAERDGLARNSISCESWSGSVDGEGRGHPNGTDVIQRALASLRARVRRGQAFDPSQHPRKLNVGCGYDKRLGYLNVDLQGFHDPDLVADFRDLHMLPSGFYEELVAQDVLEHVKRDEILPALREWNRVLEIGGRLGVRTTDLVSLGRWLQESDDPERHRLVVHLTFGTQAYEGDYHLCGFTEALLRDYLAAAGFGELSFGERLYDGWLWEVEAVKVAAWQSAGG